jgi:hypothetical protein
MGTIHEMTRTDTKPFFVFSSCNFVERYFRAERIEQMQSLGVLDGGSYTTVDFCYVRRLLSAYV